jgi:hypothetical protein
VTVTVTVSDGSLTDVQSFTLTFNPSSTTLTNPTLAISPPTSPSKTASFNLSFSGTFSVGTILTVYGDQNCSQSFGSTTVTTATATASGFSPVPLLVTIPMDGSHNLHVKQTDTNGNFSENFISEQFIPNVLLPHKLEHGLPIILFLKIF